MTDSESTPRTPAWDSRALYPNESPSPSLPTDQEFDAWRKKAEQKQDDPTILWGSVYLKEAITQRDEARAELASAIADLTVMREERDYLRAQLVLWVEKFEKFEDRYDGSDGGWQSTELETLVATSSLLLDRSSSGESK